MSDKRPDSSSNPSTGTDKTISSVCVIGGALVFVVLNQVTEGKVPGGAVGGAIGGVLGGLLALGINAIRRK